MLEFQKIKRLVIILLKGLPVLIISIIIFLLVANKIIQYSQPKYQTMAKIELDDQKYGFSGNNLYNDFDVFTGKNKIETEAEVLKSNLLIKKTIKAIGLDWKIERRGSIRNSLLFKDSPIQIKSSNHESIIDLPLTIEIDEKHNIIVQNEEETLATGKINEPFKLLESTIEISINPSVVDKLLFGSYEVKLLSEASWINVIKENLDVKAIDKEISILRVVYTSNSPEFASTFINRLCEIYVEDYIETKTSAANKALGFINSRISEIEKELSHSESDLEKYKLKNHVVNTLQETETGLREISKLKLELINVEANELAIVELESYIKSGNYYSETAINFGFGDLNLVELLKKLKLYSDEKKDLKIKYTSDDARVLNCQEKIDDVELYIKEAIQRNKKEIQIKRSSIEFALIDLEKQFDNFPTREKDIRRLEREFLINESVYNFLSQKRIEAQIASSAMMSFHRIIQKAQIPKEPVSPNRILITFVCGFLGLSVGLLLIFAQKFVSGKVFDREDIEKLTTAEIIGALTNHSNKQEKTKEFNELVGQIELANQSNQVITIASSMKTEGKTYCSEAIVNTYNAMNYSICHINLIPSIVEDNAEDLKKMIYNEEYLTEFEFQKFMKIGFKQNEVNSTLHLAHRNFNSLINLLKKKYDKIIIDSPASVVQSESIFGMKVADLIVYIIRCKKSSIQYVQNIEYLKLKHKLENINILLNDVHSTTNFSGMFKSSSFKKNHTNNPFKRLKILISSYYNQKQ